MTEHAAKAIDANIKLHERLIVALDVSAISEARKIIDELRGAVGAFKIGLQLFTAGGPDFVREVSLSGVKVFLDLKFHDIPNTVAAAAVEAARLGVWMLNIHASGGREMMERTVSDVRSACEREDLPVPKIIAVTVLTSADQETLRQIGVERDIAEQVATLAKLTADCGLDGVVASAQEVGIIRETVKRDDFLIVTPGIRPISATNDDQRRVMTFARAIAAGSDYAVVGRPITRAVNRLAAIEEMIAAV